MSFLGQSAKSILTDISKSAGTASVGSSGSKSANLKTALKIGALGASDYSGISSALRIAQNPVGYVNSPGNVLGRSGGSSAGAGGSGGSASSSANGAFVTKNGKVQFADKDLQMAMTMINQQAQANNEWNAQQAQKQMDFQKMMSDTAHQREVADLQAAGLNPVLSAGGSGAQAMSGASASADDSNTRLIGELAAAAIEAVQNTAVGVSGAVAAGSRSSSLLKNPYVNAFMRSGASVAGAIGARALLGAVGL